MGHAGLLIDGVGWYNPSDAISYNSLGVWNRNAYYWEYSSFYVRFNCISRSKNISDYVVLSFDPILQFLIGLLNISYFVH